MPHKTDMASQTPIEVYTCDASGFPCECDCVITGIIVVAQFIETSLLQKAYNLGCSLPKKKEQCVLVPVGDINSFVLGCRIVVPQIYRFVLLKPRHIFIIL